MTVFLNGCPLRCLYCHNPDTFLMKDGAPVSDTELLSRIARYRRIFRTTQGGITLSGGEVLMQPQFASFAKYASAVYLIRRQGTYYANLAKH